MKRYRSAEAAGPLPLEKIMEAGAEEFAEHGLRGGRIESIAKRAG